MGTPARRWAERRRGQRRRARYHRCGIAGKGKGDGVPGRAGDDSPRSGLPPSGRVPYNSEADLTQRHDGGEIAMPRTKPKPKARSAAFPGGERPGGRGAHANRGGGVPACRGAGGAAIDSRTSLAGPVYGRGMAVPQNSHPAMVEHRISDPAITEGGSTRACRKIQGRPGLDAHLRGSLSGARPADERG